MDQAAQVLASLEEGLEKEELEACEEQDCDDDEVDNPLLERWVNFHKELTEEELDEISMSVWPVWSMLTKVRVMLFKFQVELTSLTTHQLCKFSYAVKKSSTILLPHWYEMLSSCSFPCRMMPCNVSTHWNLTYDMLLFALEFCLAIDSMTETCELGLWKYELNAEEWSVAGELKNVLRVCIHSFDFLFT
jgi:hypothetical protein